MNSILFIAFRHLLKRRRQSVLALLGVAAGSMILVLTLSLTEGLIDAIVQTVIEITPPVTLKGKQVHNPVPDALVTSDILSLNRHAAPSRREDIRPVLDVINKLKQIPEVQRISSYIELRALLRSRGRFQAVRLLGVDGETDNLVVPLTNKLISGSVEELAATPDGIILGYRVARELNVSVPDTIRVITANGTVFSHRVVGLMKTGLKSLDESRGYINLRRARLLSQVPETAADGIRIGLSSLASASDLARKLPQITGYEAETWEDQNRNMLELFKRNNRITLFLVLFTFVVAGFGIRNVLVTIVLEKVRDIAVLRSLGVTKRSTILIFIVEGLFISIVGSLIGLIIAGAMIFVIRSLPISYGEAAVITTDGIPMAIKTWFFIITALFNSIIGLFASLSPARKAAQVDPVQILRGGK